MKVLIVIDMQNDFIDGSLANPAAAAIVDKVADYVKNFDGEVIFTRDTHHKNYLYTYEGQHLPIEHCIEGHNGWLINDKIFDAAQDDFPTVVNKPTFGYADEIASAIELFKNKVNPLSNAGLYNPVEQIEFVGTVTEICVISNVLGLKPLFPDADFIVHADMCAGLSEEGHKAALLVMRACQVNVIGE